MLNEEAIRAAAREAILEITRTSVADDEQILSSGLIDSLSVLKLIAKLEQKLNVSIPPHNLQPDDFDTVDLIVETVQRAAKPKT